MRPHAKRYWQASGCDWARPADPAARSRLYGRRLAAMRGQVASAPELHPDLSAALLHEMHEMRREARALGAARDRP
ncbi:hypothetical protein WME73_36045 [Sorangium sp. So ce302]|uniref:hypothetical protein n=1 Tax=Sorangium sp. So ce302 TaxID=3133297 RepID=UPI003F60B738